MSLIDDDSDSFLIELSSLERLIQEIQNKIGERDYQSSVKGKINFSLILL